VNTVISTTGATTAVAAISARGLRKSYGEKTVLDGIDLTVPQGTILALLGPNGAGKTTAIHLLTTYLRPDIGEIRIVGLDPPRTRRRSGARSASPASSPPSTATSPAART
jgi:ABC-2 type transport system ATP-binding protein